jgi:predicted nuclease of predicted toxin-antitoxin system
MQFLLDENTSKSLAKLLNHIGHSTIRIKEVQPGAEDIQVLELAVQNEAVLITLDKDFGELIFKDSKSHSGVIFLKLADQTTGNIEEAIVWFLSEYPESRIINKFSTISRSSRSFKARFK